MTETIGSLFKQSGGDMKKKNYMGLAVMLAAGMTLTACSVDEDSTSERNLASDESSSMEETLSDQSDSSETTDTVADETTGDYSMCTDVSAEEVEEFAADAKQALLDGDWTTVADMTYCPIDIAGTTYDYNEDLANADITLTDDFKSALEKETCRNMFVNSDGIMLGNGQVWINELLNDDGTSMGLKITAINDGTQSAEAEEGDSVSDISAEDVAMSKHCYDGILNALDSGDGDDSPVLLGDIDEYGCMQDHYFMLADLNGDDLDELIVNQSAGKELGDYFAFAYASDSKEAYCMSEKENGYANAPQVWSDNADKAVLYGYDTCEALEKDYSIMLANNMYNLAAGEDTVDLAAEFIQTSLKDGDCKSFTEKCGDGISFEPVTDDAEVEYTGSVDGKQIMSCSMIEGGFVDYTSAVDGVSFLGMQIGDSYDDVVSQVEALGFTPEAGDTNGRYFYNGTAYDSFCVCIEEENGKVTDLDVCTYYKYAN